MKGMNVQTPAENPTNAAEIKILVGVEAIPKEGFDFTFVETNEGYEVVDTDGINITKFEIRDD